jgi:hypothetical protein
MPAVPNAPGAAIPTPTPAGLPQTSGKAIASLVCGMMSLIFPAAIAAVILGHISRSEIRKSGGRLKGDGLALVGLIFGYAGLAFIPIVIIAAIAIPNLLRARISANESSAISAIRAISAAETSYREKNSAIGYACDLETLGAKNSSESSAGLIDPELANGEKHGYIFKIRDCTAETFAVTATPRHRDQTGIRTFCSREDLVIHTGRGSEEDCLENGDPL